MIRRPQTELVKGDSIRVLTDHLCQERCRFCHREGADDYMKAPVGVREVVDFSLRARDVFGLDTDHLTGGEPTLHPHIVQLVGALKDEDFKVQMTTNGDLEPKLLDRIIGAGVDSINFSMYAVDPQDFKKSQADGACRNNNDFYTALMKRKLENIERAREKVRVKLNTVVIDEPTTGKVLDLAIKENLPIRIMRDLNRVEVSEGTIQRLLSQRGLMPILEQVAVGDSGGAGMVYGYDENGTNGPDIKVKRFGDVYLDSICSDCPRRDTPSCRERFYGMRFGVNPFTQQHEVKLCIDRDDEKVIVSPDELFKGRHCEALARNYGHRER